MTLAAPPPPAPIASPGRAELLETLRGPFPRRQLPITLGRGFPEASVNFEDGQWVLYELSVDHEAAERAHQERIARGDTYWMPEHTMAFIGRGKLLASSKSKSEFIDAIEKLPWRFAP